MDVSHSNFRSYQNSTFCSKLIYAEMVRYSLLTLGAHAPEGYSTWSVCLCVCVSVFSLFWQYHRVGRLYK